MSHVSPIDDRVQLIAAGMAGRLRSLVLALDRLDRLESGSGAWLSDFAATELPGAAADLALRALRTAADPTNYALLRVLGESGACPISRVIEQTGQGRLMLSERLNDLVQVGLATRMIDTDSVQITEAGAALVRWINELAAAIVDTYTRPVGRSGVRG